jgi:regulator of protease activity HflC (stomatin/prohibitin superfamily)
MDITLQDKSTLSFDATATMRVVDVDKALNSIDNYGTSATLKVAAVLATKLAEVDAERLAPEKRKRLLSDLRKWINDETLCFGVECLDVSFNSFVLNVRTFRLLTDASATQTSL